MRVLSYNILDGGKGREEQLIAVMRPQRPDIVLLVEADDEQVVDKIAGDLEMDYIFGQGAGEKHAAAILTRWRIEESINHSLLRPGLTDSVLEATIIDEGAKPCTVAAIHLHARATFADERKREEEIAAILDIFSEHRRENRAHLLGGDFNANSPIQEIRIDQCKPRTQKEYVENGNVIPRSAVQMLLDAGYVDTLHAVLGDAARHVTSFSTEQPGQRVDYIFSFGTPRDKLIASAIIQTSPAKTASDHYPVMLEIA